jgi:hypothetical protein
VSFSIFIVVAVSVSLISVSSVFGRRSSLEVANKLIDEKLQVKTIFDMFSNYIRGRS